ncbi:MAG: HK97 family phage prohead protease [Rhodoplanes sp.]
MTTERRAATELRVAGRKLVGHAAVFGARADILGMFTEEVAPGAFTRSLAANADVVGLVDHDPSMLLARTRSGTLRLAEDARGLSFELDLPDTQLGRDTLALAERGDIGGASFGFRVPKGRDSWHRDHRTLRDVDLVDISIVNSFPAYPQTTVQARMRGRVLSLPLALAKRRLAL